MDQCQERNADPLPSAKAVGNPCIWCDMQLQTFSFPHHLSVKNQEQRRDLTDTQSRIMAVFSPMGVPFPMDIVPRDSIVQQFWGPLTLEQVDTSGLQAYFRYYDEECAKYDGGGMYNRVKTQQDIVEIVRYLRQDITREDLRRTLLRSDDHSIDLTVRLLLMVNVGMGRSPSSPRPYVEWRDGSLEDLTHAVFPSTSMLNSSELYIGKNLTAHNMVKSCGFRLLWTSNLADHLRFDVDNYTLIIFHYATFLKLQQK